MRSTAIAVVLVTCVVACVTSAQAFEMEWVTVGDPGNTPDDEVMTDGTSGYGGVAYAYKIGKYEVTNAQYAEFLNAVAATDPHGLHSPEMDSGYGGITRNGPDGSYTYTAIAGREQMPVAYVSWYDSLRFANWMHNGQGSGDTEDGAYDMSLGTGIVRKPGALVFLPGEDEWYKAAYYKGGGTNAGYWDYPTATDNLATAEVPPGADMVNGSANYGFVVGDMTDVGAYTTKPSDGAYGTFDQGGNVWEWNEADMFGDGAYRGVRGGSFTLEGGNLHASYRWLFADPPHESYLGIRVASEICTGCDDDDSCTTDRCIPGHGCHSTPFEVTGVGWSDKTTLAWDPRSPDARYDVAKGFGSELPVGGGTFENCVASGIFATSATDSAEPGDGEVFWYLVRGRNALCGIGTYGYRGNNGIPGAERITATCP